MQSWRLRSSRTAAAKAVHACTPVSRGRAVPQMVFCLAPPRCAAEIMLPRA